MLLPHMPLASELTIARVGKAQPVLERLQLAIEEGENSSEVARKAAEEAIEIAELDAGDKPRRYVIAVFGKGIPGRTSAKLDSIQVTIRTDGDDDESVGKTAQRIMSDMGDRHIRVLDQQIGLMERLMPMHSQADQMGAATLTAQGTTQIRLTELAIAREERKEMIDLALQLMPLWSGIGRAASDYVSAHAERVRANARAAASSSSSSSSEPSSSSSSSEPSSSASSSPPPAPSPPRKAKPGQVVAEVRGGYGLQLAPDGVLEVTDEAMVVDFATQTIAVLADHAADGMIIVGSLLGSALGMDWNPLLSRIAGGTFRDAATRYERAHAEGAPIAAQVRAIFGLEG